MSHNPELQAMLPEIYRRTVLSMAVNQVHLWKDKVLAADKSATPDDRVKWKEMCDAQDGLIKAMVILQQSGGPAATWGMYYQLVGCSDEHLTEEEKNTLVTETI